MRLFLTILEGPTPKEAVPILATEDREFIQAVVDRIESAGSREEAVESVAGFVAELKQALRQS